MIQKKLLELQKKGISVQKHWNNPFTKSKYVLLDDLIETYRAVLCEAQIVIYHTMREDGVLVTTLHDCEDDTMIQACFPRIESQDPQKLWSAITYGKRYNLWQLLNIVTDEDDDGNTGANKGKEAAKTSDKKEKPLWFNEKPHFENFKQGVIDGKIDAPMYEDALKIIAKRWYAISSEMKEKLKAFYNSNK